MLYLGRDGESFYLDRTTRDVRGVLADNRVCEANASDVRGYSLSEAFRRLDKKEDRLVEEKWKPIMAARRDMAGETAEEGQVAEGRLAESGEKPGEEAQPESQPDASPPLAEGHRRAFPIVYADDSVPENKGKRKRCNLDQGQESARSSTFVPQASKLAFARIASTTEKAALSSSALLDQEESASFSARFQEAHACQQNTLPRVPIASPSAGHPPRADGPSANKAGSLLPAPSSAKKATQVSASGKKTPITVASKAGPGHSTISAFQQSRPLKFAPNPASKLCNRRSKSSNGVSIVEQEKQQSGDSGSHE